MKQIFLFVVFIFPLLSRDFTPEVEAEIHRFLIHNYDRFIYECFADEKSYFEVLSQKLAVDEKEAGYIYQEIVGDEKLCYIDNPPHFFYRVNDILKSSKINKAFVDR